MAKYIFPYQFSVLKKIPTAHIPLMFFTGLRCYKNSMILQVSQKNKAVKTFFVFSLVLFAIEMGTRNGSEAQANLVPRQLVKKLLDTVKRIKKSEPDEHILLTPEDERRNGELSRQINQMLDIEGISAYALWREWEKRSAQERDMFVDLFTMLLERVAYTHAGKFMRDLTISVHKEKVLKNKAMVYTSIYHEEEGRIDIDFKLLQNEKGWLVQDVFLDGVSLARNLRTQCLKVIREHSFQELLSRMRKRIEEEGAEELEEITGRN